MFAILSAYYKVYIVLFLVDHKSWTNFHLDTSPEGGTLIKSMAQSYPPMHARRRLLFWLYHSDEGAGWAGLA